MTKPYDLMFRNLKQSKDELFRQHEWLRVILSSIGDAVIAESIQMSRSLSIDLSPPVLYENGLAAGLEWLVRWMRDKHAFDVDLSMDSVTELPEDVKVLVFESVRELLFNAFKHASVPRAQVAVQQINGTGVRVTVRDEGCAASELIFAIRACIGSECRQTSDTVLVDVK